MLASFWITWQSQLFRTDRHTPARAMFFDWSITRILSLKLTPRTVAEARNGKATHATFFPMLVSKFGSSRIAWGSNYPASEGSLPELLKVSHAALSVLSPEDRDWIFARTALPLYPSLAGK